MPGYRSEAVLAVLQRDFPALQCYSSIEIDAIALENRIVAPTQFWIQAFSPILCDLIQTFGILSFGCLIF